MDFIPIFGGKYSDESCKIWAVRYSDQRTHELRRLLALWRNVEYIRQFFTDNISLLRRSHWKHLDVNYASLQVVEEAYKIINELEAIEDAAQQGVTKQLYDFFRPLSNNEFCIGIGERVKGKADIIKPLLRIYGLRLDEDQILITGGGIKLADTMQASGLEVELDKIQRVKQYCKQEQISFLE